MTIKFKTNQAPMLQEAYRNGSIVCAKFNIGDMIYINGVCHKVISVDGCEYGLEVFKPQSVDNILQATKVTKKRGRPRKVSSLNSKNENS